MKLKGIKIENIEMLSEDDWIFVQTKVDKNVTTYRCNFKKITKSLLRKKHICVFTFPGTLDTFKICLEDITRIYKVTNINRKEK